MILDGAVARPIFQPVARRLAQYAEAGGSVVFGILFSSFVSPPNMERLFGDDCFGLKWQSGDYHRSTFVRYPGSRASFAVGAWPKLVDAYSMKALHLKNVVRDAKVYVPTEESRTQSMVFAPERVDQSQCPAVFAPYGGNGGSVGYIGDNNCEAEAAN